MMRPFDNLRNVIAVAAAICCITYSYALVRMHHRCCSFQYHHHHRLQQVVVLNDHIHSDTAGTATPINAASSVRSLRDDAIHPVRTAIRSMTALLLVTGGVAAVSSSPHSAASAAATPSSSSSLSSSHQYIELQGALSDLSSLDEGEFAPDDFYRLDESSDDIFYTSPRFVEHINPSAVKALTAFHGEVLVRHSMKGTSIGSGRRLNVLDLCSSWVSHVPPVEGIQLFNRFVGLGMNRQELERNSQLTEWRVQDLNKDSSLSTYRDASFDAVLLQLSIDYLIHPVEVLREVSRVLVPGGLLIIRYSVYHHILADADHHASTD